MTDGVAIVDKPQGLTSHDVVARIRRQLGIRKVGHAGTLDPAATGVLVIGVGRATRLLGFLTQSDKVYETVIRLGVTTSTDDAAGVVLERVEGDRLDAITDDAVMTAVASFIGTIDQVPSSVSAVKVNGRRAHERVRSGEDVHLSPRQVTITRFDVHRINRSPESCDLVATIECSAGTYVRALARDLGRVLGIGGHVHALRRIASGPFRDGVPLDDFLAQPEFISLGAAACAVMPCIRVDDVAAVRHGRPIPWTVDDPQGTIGLVDIAGTLLAVAEANGDRIRYRAVFTDGSES